MIKIFEEHPNQFAHVTLGSGEKVMGRIKDVNLEWITLSSQDHTLYVNPSFVATVYFTPQGPQTRQAPVKGVYSR